MVLHTVLKRYSHTTKVTKPCYNGTIGCRKNQKTCVDIKAMHCLLGLHWEVGLSILLMILKEMKSIIVLIFACLSVALSFEFVEEWHRWKGQHQKSYTSELEELERHAIWSSNKKYIEEHNARSDIFGYTLAMNSLGDLVRSVLVHFV